MATYYIRKTGNDSNSGTSAGSAWLTFGRALGSSGISSGDTVYVGAGVYREVVTIAMTTAVANTYVIGDVDGKFTGDAGEIRWTAFTTNDKTTPAAAATLDMNMRDYLIFQKIVFVGGNANPCVIKADGEESTNCSFEDCTFIPGSGVTHNLIFWKGKNNGVVGAPTNVTFDRCRFMKIQGQCLYFDLAMAGSEYDSQIAVKNCLFIGGGGTEVIACVTTGVVTNFGGGIRILNCTSLCGSDDFVKTLSISTLYPVQVYNCALIGSGLNADTLNEIQEDYNIIQASSPTFNTLSGGHSIGNGSYSLLFHIGQELAQGKYGRPAMMPTVDSPFLGTGGGPSTQTYDLLNAARPSGPAITWGNASTAVGCLEFGNAGFKETTTYNTSPTSLKIAGPGYHDFDFAVDASTLTVGVYARFDSGYGAATKPQMKVLNGGECGVSDATAVMTVSANTWEQITLTFTPTSRGIVTIRLQSNTTSGTGNTYWDDFSVS